MRSPSISRLAYSTYKTMLKWVKNSQYSEPSSVFWILVSGGKDSTALLRVFIEILYYPKKEFPIEVKVVHFNHLTRGKQNHEEEAFVVDLCLNWGIEVKTFTLPKSFHNVRENSQQSWAQWRYDTTYQEMLKCKGNKHKNHFLCTAHHLQDHSETVMLNLLRGCGPNGLLGFTQTRECHFVPFLGVSVDTLKSYLKSLNQPWCEDPSNQEDNYLRNALRIHVFPKLQDLQPKIFEHFLELSQSLTKILDPTSLKSTSNKTLFQNQIPGKILEWEPNPYTDDVTSLYAAIRGSGVPELMHNLTRRKIDNLIHHWKLPKFQENFVELWYNQWVVVNKTDNKMCFFLKK